MVRGSRSIWFVLLAVLGLALGLGAQAAAPPFPVNWQGVKAPAPQGAYWFAQTVLNGKLYLFGGLASSEALNSITLNTTQIYDPASDTWTTGAAMPTARYLASACAVNGKIYVMGGRTIDSDGVGGPVNSNEVYDPAANTWATATPTPSAIRGHMAAAFNNKIYVFGGNTGSYQKTVSIYDPATSAWSTGAAMAATRGYGAAIAVPSKGRIYVIGGDNGGSASSKYLGNAISYDPAANTWDSGSIPMIDKVSNFACALDSVANKIYVFSGGMWDTANNADGAVSYKTQILDTASNTFSESATLLPSPFDRQNATAGFSGGTIYLIGGDASARLVDALDTASGNWFGSIASLPSFDADSANCLAVNGKLYLLNGAWSNFNAQVFVYDPGTSAWTNTNATNPAPRYGGVADVSDGKIVFADGSNSTAVTGDAQLYDPATDTFTALSADPTPTLYASGAVVSGKLYVFGGYDTAASAPVATVRALDIASKTWSTKASLPVALYWSTATALNGKIYIFGGFDGSSGDTTNATVHIYDPASDSFTTGPTMPISVYQTHSAAFGNYILVYGGDNLYFQDVTRYYRPAGFLQVLDTTTGTFTSVMGLYTRVNHQIAVIGNNMYAIGGDDNTYPIDRMDIASLSSGPAALAAQASADKTSGAPPLTVNFTGGATGGTSPYTYDWDFGDGSAHASTQNATHTYATANTYTAKLTVHDAAAATASKTITISVAAGALAATASADHTSGSAPLAVNFTGGATGGTAPYTYSWDFGDGSAASTTQNPSHTYAAAGSFTATLTVHDSASATATAHVAITVTSVAPPVISSMKKASSPFRFIVYGSNLQNGVTVKINGTPYTGLYWKTTSKVVLKGTTLKATVPKGVSTTFTFTNPDGGSTTYTWSW